MFAVTVPEDLAHALGRCGVRLTYRSKRTVTALALPLAR